MSKKLVYPPIRLLEKVKNSCPGIAQKYEEFENESTNTTSSYDIATRTAQYYYPIYTEAAIKKAVQTRKASVDLIQHMRKTQTKKYEEEREWSTARIATLMEWRKEKYVYKVSNSFFKLLCNTRDIEIDISMFDSLPHNCFYIEFEESKDIDGMFLYYMNDSSEQSTVVLIPVNAKLQQHSLLAFNLTRGSKITNSVCTLQGDMWKDLVTFAVHLLMYICSRNSDIVEDEEQKKLYKKSDQILDRYSEVQKLNVGYNTFYDELIFPHPYWHRYRVGKGRKKVALKFVL